MANRSSFAIMVKKKLSDITNLQSFHRIDEISVPISPTSKDCIDKLKQENAKLMKLIEERNKLVELSGVEIQKMRILSQKLQLQNWNLAQSNNHLLAAVNAGKGKLKALQHEIACKNAVIMANKLALKGNEMANPEDREEKDADKCLHKIDDDNEPGKSKTICAVRSQSMIDCSAIQEAADVKANNKRHCLRRQSARFKSEQGEPTEKLLDRGDIMLQTTFDACSTIQQDADKETSKSKRSCLRRQSARFKSEQAEPPEKLLEIDDTKLSTTKSLDMPMGMETHSLDSCSTVQQAADKETAKNRRQSSRRSSARLKSEQCEPTEKLFAKDFTQLLASKSHDIPMSIETQTSLDSSLLNVQSDNKAGISDVRTQRSSVRSSARTDLPAAMGSCSTFPLGSEEETAKNKRQCTRRQSARIKSEHRPAEKFVDMEGTKLPASNALDIPRPADTQASLDPTANNEQKDAKLETLELHHSQRPSIGRPPRRASAKVQSYKEPPLNVKMRREE